MGKPIIYSDVPDFDQETQFVVEKRTEYEDRVQVDFEIADLAVDETPMPDTAPGEFVQYVQEPTLEEKVAAQGDAIQEIILAIMGG